jgi:hypothetical protein
MSSKQSDHERQLEAVMNAMAESVAQASDEDILAEAAQEGQDADAVAASVREMLLSACKACLQEKLRDARKKYERDVAALDAKEYSLPKTSAERRRLLASVFQRRPELVTVQWREFDSLTDDDIESSLKQMQELGILDDLERDEEK